RIRQALATTVAGAALVVEAARALAVGEAAAVGAPAGRGVAGHAGRALVVAGAGESDRALVVAGAADRDALAVVLAEAPRHAGDGRTAAGVARGTAAVVGRALAAADFTRRLAALRVLAAPQAQRVCCAAGLEAGVAAAERAAIGVRVADFAVGLTPVE